MSTLATPLDRSRGGVGLTNRPTQTGFWQSGHTPTLIAAFLYFDVSFMVWVMLGPLAPIISAQMHLDSAQKGFMVAVPTLAGAVLRIVNGLASDRIGQKVTGIINQVIVMAGLALTWRLGVATYEGALALGVILGFAGASFAIALPMAGRWYSGEHQGKAMGIAGMGNSGTVFASLFAALLAKAYGWTNVFGLALIPLALVFVYFLIAAKDSPDQPPAMKLSAYAKVLAESDAWWFMLFYFVTFGGFVGLSSSLPTFFVDSFKVTPVVAGYCTAACVFTGSLLRPLGGAQADHFGGIRTLTSVYILIAILLAVISIVGGVGLLWAVVLFVAAMGTLGIGNGAVFQLVPQRFRKEIGVMTGLVGFGGGIGGFYLASSLGVIKQATGSVSIGFLIFSGLALLAVAGLTSVKHRWRTTWGAAAEGVKI